MGIPVSLLLIAAGAILTWAVNKSPSGLNIHVVGVILMVVGAVGLALTLAFWESFWGRGAYRRRAYAEGAPPRAGYPGRRRETYVEEEAPPPAEPPPGPPPP